MSGKRLLIFDMDGVLVDVKESYRQSVVEAVKKLSGETITHAEIQLMKNRGNSNNDWDLTLELAHGRGSTASREEVKKVFQKIYMGENCQGLIARERWLAGPGLLERLSVWFRFALFTGREGWEARYTLKKFTGDIRFDPIVSMEDVQREKPDPEGLHKILREVAPEEVFYVGDVMDDFSAAKSAGVPFIGVVGNGDATREKLGRTFLEGGAVAVIADVNELERVLG